MNHSSDHLWNISKIFSYSERYQKSVDSEIDYYNCTFLVDFGEFKKGYECDITIWPQTYGSFAMHVDTQKEGKNVKFLPIWTQLKDETFDESKESE